MWKDIGGPADRRGWVHAASPLVDPMTCKLASGMTAPHRLKDLADVIELVRANALPVSFGERLHPYVRERFAELWQAAQTPDAQ